MNQTESALIEQLKQGSQGAFAQLVQQYEQLVYNTALGIVQQATDAEDITQEVFVQVYQSIEGFKGDAKLSTWLYRITISKALDHEKKRHRKKRFAFIYRLIGDKGEEVMHPPEFNHPGVLLDNKEKAQVLFKAIKALPEQQRLAFTLNKVEGLSNHEIAEVLNLSFQAVESLQARAKKNLRKSLEQYYQQQSF